MGWVRWPIRAIVGAAAVTVVGLVVWSVGPRSSGGRPVPHGVPSGDQEIVWVHNTTGEETWAFFVLGMKRAEMAAPGSPGGLLVDETRAFPAKTTAVPELVVSRAGVSGKLRIRWYKVSAGATLDAWVEALAARDPAPLAVIGGATSDRAHELALALNREKHWRGDPPLLLITTATIEKVRPPNAADDLHNYPPYSEVRDLLDVYPGRSFRFCFSNAQMVNSVTEFVLQNPTLHPGPIGWPGLRAVGAGAAGTWATMPDLAQLGCRPTVFPLKWEDDPYSVDLFDQFREHLFAVLGGHIGPKSGPRIVSDPTFSIPFSVGGFSRMNPGEGAAVRAILRNLPPPGERALVIIPSGSNPTRRVLLALSERVPGAGRRLVAVTGDGISVNTFYRDAEWAWSARSIPIPLVFFSHANPFGWDDPNDPTPPASARLDAQTKTTTEEVLLDTTLSRAVVDAVLAPAPPGELARIADSADVVAARLRARPDKFFDEHGNRRGQTGEHVVVVRPTTRYGDTTPGAPRPESTIEAYRLAADGVTWSRVGSVQVLPEKPDDRTHPD